MTTPEFTTDEILDTILEDIGSDPDTQLSEDELNEIIGTHATATETTVENAVSAEAVEEPPADKPKRGRPRKVVESAQQPTLSGMIVGVDLSPQTLAEMEAGRKAISRGALG